MKGKFPDILNSPTTGEEARKLYDDAQKMLDRVIEEGWLTANAVFGLFPANAVGDDIEVYTDDTRSAVRAMLINLRQRSEEHTSELQSIMRTSYAVYWLKNKKQE